MRPWVGDSRPEIARSVERLAGAVGADQADELARRDRRGRGRAAPRSGRSRRGRSPGGAAPATQAEASRASEIGADHVRDAPGSPPARPSAITRPPFSDDHGVRDAHHHAHVVLDEQDGHALLANPPDETAHDASSRRRSCRRRARRAAARAAAPRAQRPARRAAARRRAGHWPSRAGGGRARRTRGCRRPRRRDALSSAASRRRPARTARKPGGAAQVEPGQHVVLDAQRREDARASETSGRCRAGRSPRGGAPSARRRRT